NNSCPIQLHDNCQYSRSNAVRKYIGDLTVMCIKQFEQDLKTLHETGTEGEISKCDFKGKLKDLNNHLINECTLNLIDCWFKPFGCNHTCVRQNIDDHLISKMKLHFNLVTKLLQSMKQEIQLKDNRIKQMERDFQQELLKYRADIEIIKKDFNDKEQQASSNHEKIVKLLEEKNTKLLQKLNLQYKQKEKEEEDKKQTHESSSVSSKLIKTFDGHTNTVNSIDYSTFDDFQFICSGSDDKTVRVWNIDSNKQIQSFNGHSDYVCCVKFSRYHYHNNRQNIFALHHMTKPFVFGISNIIINYKY
ncbi:WD-40 repeat protein, partial [Reticulomyxa filosa]